MSTEPTFHFDVVEPASQEFIPLAEAMQILEFGGLLRVRLDQEVPGVRADESIVFMDAEGTFRLCPDYAHVLLKGPHIGSVARYSGILYGLGDDTSPDSRSLDAALERHRIRQDRYSFDLPGRLTRRRWSFSADVKRWRDGELQEKPTRPAFPNPPTAPSAANVPNTWTAEYQRRLERLQCRMNEDAKKKGKLRLRGCPVTEAACLEPSPCYPAAALEEISPSYFEFSRDFDGEHGRIHAVSVRGADLCYEHTVAMNGHISYSNVQVCLVDLRAVMVNMVASREKPGKVPSPTSSRSKSSAGAPRTLSADETKAWVIAKNHDLQEQGSLPISIHEAEKALGREGLRYPREVLRESINEINGGKRGRRVNNPKNAQQCAGMLPAAQLHK